MSDSELLMDECLLLDDYEDRLHHREYTDRNDDDRYAFDRLPAKKEKSSHELVEMTADGETPKRIRDGQFGKFSFSHHARVVSEDRMFSLLFLLTIE